MGRLTDAAPIILSRSHTRFFFFLFEVPTMQPHVPMVPCTAPTRFTVCPSGRRPLHIHTTHTLQRPAALASHLFLHYQTSHEAVAPPPRTDTRRQRTLPTSAAARASRGAAMSAPWAVCSSGARDASWGERSSRSMGVCPYRMYLTRPECAHLLKAGRVKEIHAGVAVPTG